MNANSKNTFLNSLLPPLNMLNSAAANGKNSAMNFFNSSSSSGESSFPWFGILLFVILVGAFITVMVVFKDQLESSWNSAKEAVMNYFGESKAPAEAPGPAPAQAPAAVAASGPEADAHSSLVDKILPTGNEVFNVSSNKYTYNDAEPLCKALGAELASYDQVKEAWSKGADWCNYGWVKGQMAVYPTSDESYQKAQAGPEGQRTACGRPGVNGGYFDNPELRFGVNCYGNKPPQSKHDEREVEKGAPVSPDALAFDKKVAHFKTEAESIGLLPFNGKKW